MDPVLEAIKAMDEKFGKRLDAIEKFQDDGDDDDAKKKKEKEEADAKEKEKNAHKGKAGYDDEGNKIPDEDDDKDKSRSQADKETFAVLHNKLDSLSTSVKQLTEENKALNEGRITDEIDSKIVFFKRVGIELGDDEKVEKFKKSLAKLDATERQSRYDEIEEHWGRVPIGVTIDREGVIGDNTNAVEGPVDEAAKNTILAMKYSDQHGISMSEAMSVLQNQGVKALESYKKTEGAGSKLQY